MRGFCLNSKIYYFEVYILNFALFQALQGLYQSIYLYDDYIKSLNGNGKSDNAQTLAFKYKMLYKVCVKVYAQKMLI